MKLGELEKKKHNNVYLNMIVSSLGMILIVFGMVKYISINNNMADILLIWLGFLIMIHYIYSLERQTGISNKLIWIRAAVLILTLIISAVVYF